MKRRRAGSFRIDGFRMENFDLVREIQKDVAIWRADHCILTDSIVFLAVSPHFDEVEMGYEIPEYEPVMSGEGKLLRWQKRDQF